LLFKSTFIDSSVDTNFHFLIFFSTVCGDVTCQCVIDCIWRSQLIFLSTETLSVCSSLSTEPTQLATTFCVYDGCGFRSRLCPPWVDEVNKTKLHFRVSPAAGINTVLGAVLQSLLINPFNVSYKCQNTNKAK
jgi:hypothetical protein